MSAVLSPLAKQKFFDNNGKPAAGYKLFTYEAGTSTKLDSYVNSAGVTPNANPIVLDFRGECNLWLPPNVAYKFVLAPPNDTDPPTAAIWSVDDIADSQLVTLYGGVDTGIANAYVLNFVANFTSYDDGIVIYWIPSNTNTGASTINVNGLGPVALTNQDGSALIAGQIQANQIAQILYKGSGFVVLSSLTVITSGTVELNFTGVFGTVPVQVDYSRFGNIVTLGIATTTTGTSNSTAFGLTALPAALRPSSDRSVTIGKLIDNGVAPYAGEATVVSVSGVTQFSIMTGALLYSFSAFTGSGTKGISAGWSITYSL